MVVLSAKVVEYTDSTSADGLDPTPTGATC